MSLDSIRILEGVQVSKDKKKKKGKKTSVGKGAGLKALAKNPLVADVVAAALVATASALKDSKRARALASEAGDELSKLSKAGAEAGNALWDMALQIGRRSLEALTTGEAPQEIESENDLEVQENCKEDRQEKGAGDRRQEVRHAARPAEARQPKGSSGISIL